MSRINLADTRYAIVADWRANPRAYKVRITLVSFRVTQWLMRDLRRPRRLSYPCVALYRMMTEWLFGLELRPTTSVAPGLRIHHGFGLVVNPQVRIGRNVTLRNGVVLGNKTAGGDCPIIEDDVEFGANAVAIGGLRIGRAAKVGAGAVVTRDVPAGSVVVGSPARVIGLAHEQ